MGKIIKESVKKGFSLVEVSVVLAILGLLTGAIVAGQSMLNGQRKNAIITKANGFRTAYAQFKLKYGYGPGDLPTATEIWGRADGGTPVTSNCAVPSTDNANPNGTCNGDGNGAINPWSEGSRAWQQLKFAGLIEGSYNGLNLYPPVIGLTNPGSEANPKAYFGFGANYGSVAVGDYYVYDGDYRESIFYGILANGNPSMSGGGPALPGEDAYWLDAKIDDGLPSTGQVRSNKPTAQPNCTTGTVSPQYDRSQKTDVCGLIFMGTLTNK